MYKKIISLRGKPLQKLAGAKLMTRKALELSHYPGHEHLIHVAQQGTRSSNRTAPLSVKGVEILASVRPEAPKPDALVFCSTKGTPLCRRNLRNRQLDPMCEELKIPRIGWHSLRHSNATLLDAVGTPLGTVQSLLGHSSPEITRGTYIHSLPTGAREAVQKVEDLLTGPKRTQIVEIHKMASSLIQ